MSDVNMNSNEVKAISQEETINIEEDNEKSPLEEEKGPVKTTLPTPNSLALHTNLNEQTESQHVQVNSSSESQEPVRVFVPASSPNLIYQQQQQTHAPYINQPNYIQNYSSYNPSNQIPLNHSHQGNYFICFTLFIFLNIKGSNSHRY